MASELMVESAPRSNERLLPVRNDLAEVLPLGGLRRGSTVSVRGSTSLLLALLAEATETGSWAAVVGMPDLGVLAARELGVDVGRLALVPRPGADAVAVLGALLDGFDLVVLSAAALGAKTVGAQANRRAALARKLSARARHRGAVLLVDQSWPGAECELVSGARGWSGLGDGHGHLRSQRVSVAVRGRRADERRRPVEVTLPRGVQEIADTPLRLVGGAG